MLVAGGCEKRMINPNCNSVSQGQDSDEVKFFIFDTCSTLIFSAIGTRILPLLLRQIEIMAVAHPIPRPVQTDENAFEPWEWPSLMRAAVNLATSSLQLRVIDSLERCQLCRRIHSRPSQPITMPSSCLPRRKPSLLSFLSTRPQ